MYYAYGKNLNAFTSKLLAVNASFISSSVTVALKKWRIKEKNYDNVILYLCKIFSICNLDEMIERSLLYHFRKQTVDLDGSTRCGITYKFL